jgi:hypothetical protein
LLNNLAAVLVAEGKGRGFAFGGELVKRIAI